MNRPRGEGEFLDVKFRNHLSGLPVDETFTVHPSRGSFAKSEAQFPTYREFRRAGVKILEKQYLTALMSYVKGDIKKACRVSRLSRSRLYGLLKEHAVSRADQSKSFK